MVVRRFVPGLNFCLYLIDHVSKTMKPKGYGDALNFHVAPAAEICGSK